MNQAEITASVTAIGNALACQLSDDQLDLAAAIFTQLGDTLATISVVRGICSKNTSSAEDESDTSTDKSADVESSTSDKKDDSAKNKAPALTPDHRYATIDKNYIENALTGKNPAPEA